jgi:hypothetical protein
MSYLQYVTVAPNLTYPGVGCTSIQEMLTIVMWVQTNTQVRPTIGKMLKDKLLMTSLSLQAISLANQHHYATLSVPLIR